MTLQEYAKRFDPMPIADLVAAVIAIFEAIICAARATLDESPRRAHRLLVADLPELEYVKR